MTDWPELSTDNILSELHNIEPIDAYALVDFELDKENSQNFIDLKQKINEILQIYKNLLISSNGIKELSYSSSSDYYKLLNKVYESKLLDLSEEELDKYCSEYEELQFFINDNLFNFDSFCDSTQEDIELYPKLIRRCNTMEEYYNAFQTLYTYLNTTLSTSIIPSYSTITYPKEKQIMNDILRDSFCYQTNIYKGVHGFQVIAQSLLNHIYMILGEDYSKQPVIDMKVFGKLLNNTSKQMNLNEKNLNSNSISEQSNSLYKSIDPLTISFLLSPSLKDTFYIDTYMTHLFHIISRTYTGEIVYKTMEYLFPIHSPFIYVPDNSSICPVGIDMKLVLCQDINKIPFVGLLTRVSVEYIYTIKNLNDENSQLPYRILLTYTNVYIQGTQEYENKIMEKEQVCVSVRSIQ